MMLVIFYCILVLQINVYAEVGREAEIFTQITAGVPNVLRDFCELGITVEVQNSNLFQL